MTDPAEYPMYGSELALLCKSINHGWNLSPEVRAAVITRLSDVLSDPGANRRDLTRAATALANLDRLRLQSTVAAFNAAKDAKPQVVINNNIGQQDTLAMFLEGLSPDDAQEWLDKYGACTPVPTRPDPGAIAQ